MAALKREFDLMPTSRTDKEYPLEGLRVVWKPENGVTNSMLTSFLSCRHQCLLKYMFGLTPRMMNGPIEYGNCIHHVLEVAPADEKGKYLPGQEKAVAKIIAKYKKARLGQAGAVFLLPHEKTNLDELIGLASVVMPGYFRYWRERDKKLAWASRESVFKVPDVGVNIHGKPLPLTGKKDGVCKWGKGPQWLFETKGKVNVNGIEIKASLPWDMQVGIYLFAMRELLPKSLEGVCYNVVRRPSTKRGANEELPDFLARIARDVTMRPEHYYMRWTVPISGEVLDYFYQRTLKPAMDEFAEWYEGFDGDFHRPFRNKHHYMNPTALYSKYGRDQLFVGTAEDQYDEFYQRGMAHAELEV